MVDFTEWYWALETVRPGDELEWDEGAEDGDDVQVTPVQVPIFKQLSRHSRRQARDQSGQQGDQSNNKIQYVPGTAPEVLSI